MPGLAIYDVQLIRRDRVRVAATMTRWKSLKAKKVLRGARREALLAGAKKLSAVS